MNGALMPFLPEQVRLEICRKGAEPTPRVCMTEQTGAFRQEPAFPAHRPKKKGLDEFHQALDFCTLNWWVIHGSNM
ncbi:hypothetical protein [Comamonas odontotermitis]|uniref:hypothetical protein n=1 Tax=Comamonas odontotermitis TaxID=379895 RepID=UPI001610F5D2|nr:hypothetical protein [Comamonas odontotermitis]